MKKKVMMSVMAAMMMLSSSVTALAAPEVISVNGNNTVFDWEYYANTYPDVIAELGASREAMIQHYVSFGQGENREAYVAGTDVAAILAAYQEGNPAVETIVSVQTEKKQLLRKDRHYISYDSDGSVRSERDESVSYEYDAQGNLIKKVECANMILETIFTYDSLGNVIREECFHIWEDTGELCGEQIITYNYDSQGNLINRVSLSDAYMCYMETYSYDNRGNCVQMVMTYLDDDGTLIEDEEPQYYSYTYDSQGNVLTEKSQCLDDNILSSESLTQYTYK